MGRAIDMEASIDNLKNRVSKLENMLNDLFEDITRKVPVDLHEIKEEVKVEEKKNNKQRTTKRPKRNNNGNGTDAKSDNESPNSN